MDHTNPNFAKIPILDTRKFEKWKFRIQQYLQNEHYALWEVVEFGDSYKAPPEETGKGPASESSAKKKGRIVAITTKDMQKRRNDVKVRTTLLLALPDEHLLRFSKDDLDIMSLDDVYNHLKVYEPKVQKKSESNSQNMAFISSLNTSSRKATQSNSSQIKYEDITQIDEDDIEEMDIKWNMALLSLRADRFWKKISKKITIQGSDIAGFDKSKVECFSFYKMGHFARECRVPRSQDRGKRESYKQGPKEEEPTPKALMAIDGIGWDWSYMANEKENHALVTDDEVPTEFALMAKSSSSSDNEVYDDSFCSKSRRKNTKNLTTKINKLNEELSDCETDLYNYKRGLSQVEARLVEFKENKVKFYERIRVLERDVEIRDNKIEYLKNELEQFDAKGDEGYFVGYSLSSKAFRVFNKRTKKVEENLHVDFLENKLIEKGAGTKDVASQAVKKDVSSLRYIALPNWFHEAHMETSNDAIRNSDAQYDSQIEQDCNADVPKSSGISNPTATSKVPLADQVEPAVSLTVKYEIPTVSTLVPTVCLDISPDSLSDSRLISKWVFSQKETPSLGNALTLSNRFDTFGVEADLSNMETSIPEEGIDYEEVFAPIARIEAIRLFLAYASFMGFIVYQMDVKSAFLYGTIDKEVYVMQPPGFHDLEFPKRVYKVEKAVYGLHQAPRVWYGKDGPGKDVELHSYRSMIGSLMYLTASRPDIMFAVCVCVRHQVTPKECHLHAVKRIFRYLKGHPKLGLWYPKESPFDLGAYSDSDYGGATQDRKSTIRGFQFLGRRIETTDQDTKIIATIDGKPQTISESSLRRHLKLNDEEGISSFPDAELFENLSLMGYNILPNQSPESTGFNEFSSNIATAVVCLATNKVYNFSKMIFDGMVRNMNCKGTKFLMYPRQGEAFPTVSSLDAGQDKENIAKTSAMPYESSPRVSSLDADEGNQDLEISGLKARVKYLRDKERRRAEPTQEDALIIGGIIDIEEELGADKSTKLGSNDTEEMVNVLSSMEATNILSSGDIAASVSPADVFPTAGVPTASGSFPTGSAIFTTASVVAREMEEEFDRENQRLSEKLAKDYEIARIHAEEELKMIIEGLYRNFVPMSSKEESERLKRQGLKIDQGSSKRVKISKGVSEGVSGEELNGMMQLVPLEEVYMEALEDLHQLWTLVKETFSIKHATRDKEKELWVELKRLFEPNFEDQLWTYH
uniref:Uncharacterized protein n=1 Tax=Tanacetum cinerariifolium TaxID=118510 RepID=A0A6L2KZG6_TANCI|nr:hypothetical protein [Tanacetum cinerariifolium]